MVSRATGCRRTAVSSFVLAVLVAAPAAAPAKPHGLGKRVAKELTVVFVAGDAERTATLDCPKGFFLLTASWEDQTSFSSEAITVVRDAGSKGATFEINTRGTAATVQIRIICAKKKAKRSGRDHHRHELKQRFVSQPVSLPGMGQFTGTVVSCPNGYLPLSGFFDGEQTSRVTQSMPAGDGRSWMFGIEQLSAQDTTGAVGTQCLKEKTGSGGGHSHEVKVVYVSEPVEVPTSFVGPQETNVHVNGTGECPNGSFPVGAGWSFPGHPNTFLAGFSPTVTGHTPKRPATAKPTNTFDFEILNQSTEQTATVIAACLANKTTNGN